MHETFQSNFAHMGLEEKSSNVIEQISYSDFQFYTSGRCNMHWAYFKLELKRRQDLFTSLCIDPFFPTKDRLIIDIPIVPAGEQSPPLEFVVVRRRDMKNLFTTYTHLKNFV